jgi:ABC-type Fe3+-hydroxamate transport system substrate-binding protein
MSVRVPERNCTRTPHGRAPLRSTSAALCLPTFPAAALLLLLACERSAEKPATDHDDFGRPLPVLASAGRIVSLGPSSTEILYTLGAGDRIVGRSRWDRWPAEVLAIPEAGDAIRPSVERVLALHPDLVVIYAATDNRSAADALTRAGIPVVALRIDRIDQYLAAVRLLGRFSGTQARADSIAERLRAELDEVRRQGARAERPTVFLPAWDAPLMTLGSGSFLSELVEIAGGRNLYGDRSEPSLTISMEDVVRRDPDIVLTGPVSAARIRSDPAWRVLRAVREGRVLAYDTTLVSQPSTRLGEAARSLLALLRQR